VRVNQRQKNAARAGGEQELGHVADARSVRAASSRFCRYIVIRPPRTRPRELSETMAPTTRVCAKRDMVS